MMVHLFIAGRVQGVWYRGSTEKKAKELGLTGWVRNLSDGRVEAKACGPRDTLEALVEWCHDGPPLAVVSEVQQMWSDDEEIYKDFSTRR